MPQRTKARLVRRTAAGGPRPPRSRFSWSTGPYNLVRAPCANTKQSFELRRLLTEARARGEAFTLTYTLIDGLTGDERWRRTGPGRTVTVSEDGGGGGGGRCSVRCGPLKLLPCACATDELALLSAPGYWQSKTLVQQPYPILAQAGRWEGELVCFGP